jgi:hypothetical protein
LNHVLSLLSAIKPEIKWVCSPSSQEESWSIEEYHLRRHKPYWNTLRILRWLPHLNFIRIKLEAGRQSSMV